MISFARKSKAKRFIHISTPSVYFGYRDRYLVREDEPLPKKLVNSYAKTKLLAEEVVQDAHAGGLPSIILRPRAVFGPHDQTLFPRIVRSLREKGLIRLREVSPIIDVTYVDNVAHAIHLSLQAPSCCEGQIYNITNGEPVYLWELLEGLMLDLSIPFRQNNISYKLAMAAAFCSEALSKISNKEPAMTRYAIGVMSHSQTLSIEKAKEQLGYQPLISLSEGIHRYVEWIQTT